MEQKLRLLSLFSGCGGMDLGFEGGFKVKSESINETVHPEWCGTEIEGGWVQLPETRFETVFANDIVRSAQASWIPWFQRDESRDNQFLLASIVDLVKQHESGKKVFPRADIVTGGFPCQDFSIAGKRKGFSSAKSHHGKKLNEDEDPTEENRGKLYMWMRRVIDIVLPKVFIAENVKGLVSLADAKEVIQRDFSNIGPGYVVVNAKVLHAADFGVPQGRERVIFIGFRSDCLKKKALSELTKSNLQPEYDPYPIPTHAAESELGFSDTKVHVHSGVYLSDLEEPNHSADLSQQNYSHAKYYGSHCQGQTEVRLDRIAPTIRSEHHGNIEFRRLSKGNGGTNVIELSKKKPERRLTVRECARIQTFPDEFQFVRPIEELGPDYKLSASEGYKLIGNAVPPLLAFHIAWRLQQLWPLIVKRA
jgi:DNA (cytosine-5)-methyltransferase 1